MNPLKFLSYFVDKLRVALSYFGIKYVNYGRTPVAPSYNPDDPLQYYFDLKVKGDYKGHFDDYDIPLINYKGKLYYFPIFISEYALINCMKFLDNNNVQHINRFKKAVNWLMDNQSASGAWLSDVPLKMFGLKKAWPSAMTQGLAISCLTRAGRLLNDDKYTEAAKLALNPFTVDGDKGGVCSYEGDDIFYDEYPSIVTNHVLNGFIFSLWGLNDMVRFTGDSQAAGLFETGLNTLIKWLPEYDTGYWSLYHLDKRIIKNPASLSYHDLHIRQLNVMHQITGHAVFKEYQDRWSFYQSKRLNALRTLPLKLLYNAVYGL